MKYKEFFELFLICCSTVGYFRLVFYLLYTRLFTEEKFVKYDKHKITWLCYYFITTVIISMYFLQWVSHPIIISTGFMLLIYQLQMKYVKATLEEGYEEDDEEL